MFRNYAEETERGYATGGNRICKSASRFERLSSNHSKFLCNNRPPTPFDINQLHSMLTRCDSSDGVLSAVPRISSVVEP